MNEFELMFRDEILTIDNINEILPIHSDEVGTMFAHTFFAQFELRR